MSVDLVAFLRARLDDVERIARLADASDPAPWGVKVYENASPERYRPDAPDTGAGMITDAKGDDLWNCEGAEVLCMTGASARHAAHHDPARVLAEVAAKRQLCTLWETAERNAALPNPEGSPVYPPALIVNGYASALGYALKLAAAPYAAVDGYRPEWAPDA